MEIVRLPLGEVAPSDADCIRIQEVEDGFVLNASVLLNCGDADTVESVSLIGGDTYASYEEAEAAGLAWADEHCPERLFVSRSDGTKPLPDIA